MIKNSADWWPGVLFAALILYLILALHNLLLPGVYYDEVLQVLPAMAAVGFDVGNEFYQMPGSVITVGNVRLPLIDSIGIKQQGYTWVKRQDVG